MEMTEWRVKRGKKLRRDDFGGGEETCLDLTGKGGSGGESVLVSCRQMDGW